MKTPPFPKELASSNPPTPFFMMELPGKVSAAKTVSLSETVLQKNPVVSYGINTIYTLLLYRIFEKEDVPVMENQSSINGKGGGGYHAS